MSRRLLGFLILSLLTTYAPVIAADPLTADTLAKRILDGEGLYTLTNGLKPVSDGFWQKRFSATQDTSPEVDEARRLLASLPLGSNLEAGVFVFAAIHEGKKNASAFIIHKPSLRALVLRRPDAFGPLGITVETPSQNVMEKIDRGERAMRWRAFGLVFGYPEYAIEFFVEAGEREAETKTFVEREFIQLPTYASKEGRFVYAVPKGHAERDEDRQLKASTAEIFFRYRAWRTVYLNDRNLGAVSLLQNWVKNFGHDSPRATTFTACQSHLCPVLSPRRGQQLCIREIGRKRMNLPLELNVMFNITK